MVSNYALVLALSFGHALAQEAVTVRSTTYVTEFTDCGCPIEPTGYSTLLTSMSPPPASVTLISGNATFVSTSITQASGNATLIPSSSIGSALTISSPSTGSFSTSTTDSAAPQPTCIASGADCSAQTATFGCCASDNLTCDSTTLTCVPLNDDGSDNPSATPSAPSASTSTTNSATPQPTCIASGADCSAQTATFGCCASDNLTCDSTTLTCVPLNDDGSDNPSGTTQAAASSTTSAAASQGTCIALNADCSNQSQTFFCCSGTTCDTTSFTCVSE